MDRYEVGMLARSKAGHDVDRVYVIVDVEDAYVYLADGKIRTLDRPKKKKKKHIQPICRKHDLAGATDESIKYLLKKWKRETEKQEESTCQKLM